MKRKTLTLILVLLLIGLPIVSGGLLSACGGDSDGTGGKITLIFADENANVLVCDTLETEATTLVGLMREVADSHSFASNADIAFDTTLGTYGTTVNSFTVNGITYGNWNKGAYVMTYTSLTDAEYISVFEGSELVIEGITYNACGLGVDAMPIVEGATYVFTVMVY